MPLPCASVLVVDELVLVERHDRVAPGREVLAQVGVAAVVALERGAVRRRAGVAAAVVAVHEQDHRRAAWPGWPGSRSTRAPARVAAAAGPVSGAARGVGLLQVDRAHQDRIDGRDRVRPSRQRVRRGGERRGGRDHDQRERQGEDLLQAGRGHQFSVRSVHVCVRARTATTVRGEAARSYVPTVLRYVWTAGRKVTGQRPTEFT